MGVKNLTAAIRAHAPSAVRVVDLAAYAGQTFAVDVSIFMYKFCAGGGDVADVVAAFDAQVTTLRAHGITPVYVFDGRTAAGKQPEAAKRRAAKDRVFEQLHACERAVAVLAEPGAPAALGTPPEPGAVLEALAALDTQRRRAVAYPTRRHFADVRARLEARGIRVVQARNDAEKTCAFLTKTGGADVVVTEDMDALPYGARRMLTGLGGATLREYALDRVLAGFGFDMAMFVDYCLLCGTDICPKIRNIGNDRARRFIAAHASIEAVLHGLDRGRYGVPEPFPFAAARAEFGNPDAGCIA